MELSRGGKNDEQQLIWDRDLVHTEIDDIKVLGVSGTKLFTLP